MCQSGRNTHGILLSNSALHKLLGQFLGIVAKRYRTTCVGGYGNDIFVLLCQFQQSFCKCFSTSFHIIKVSSFRFQVYTHPSALMRSSISFIACSYCSWVGTP